MAFITSRLKAGADAAAALITHVQWSENGSSESANLARTAVTVKAATTANPSVVANDGAIESAAASGAATITHFAFAADATIQTTWNPLAASRTLGIGDKIAAEDGVLKENFSQATSAPV
jgi:hypothetical protein